ncbi:unnamed protein product [Paramecium pentaurelia]|uniref:Protein kinase domain-containing protein n=1 Tax=Paramecium pentaurelia TaxID=43138 RepID=A0A8S1WAI9_9CILI|nr:unnamed protein product [Paramecium pentaurelia]
MNKDTIDIEFIDSEDEQKNNQNSQQQNKQQIMQLEEAPSPNIFAVVIINQYKNQIKHIISRQDVITAIEYIVKNILQGSMKKIRPTDVKIEPILSTQVQKACCLIQVDENIIKQLIEFQIPLQFGDKDPQKGLTVVYEFKFFQFNEFDKCDLFSNGKFVKEFCVIRPYQETQRYTSIIVAINKMDQQIYAIKKVRLMGEFSWQRLFYNQITQIREVRAMLRLQHPNVIRLYSWWVEQEINQKNQKYFYLYLQQEYNSFLGCNDLLQFSVNHLLNLPLEFKRKTMKSLIHQLITGLEYIHGQGFFHRDLKLENILVTKDNFGDVALRICDFDWSKTHLNDDGQKVNWLQLSKDCGTVEMNNGMQKKGIAYDAKQELFQVGIIILDLCNPTPNKDERIQMHKDAKNNIFKPHILQDYQPELQIIYALLKMEFKSVQELRTSQLYNKYMEI